MKRAARLLVPLAAAVVALAYSGRVVAPTPSRSLAGFMPQGAILYLEAADFGGLLREWSGSPERQAWLESDNFAAFSRSKLVLRLESAQREFAAAAGIPPDSQFLAPAAGGESALALYNIGKLQFLFVSRMPAAQAMQSGLWRERGSFQSRAAGGVAFYVRTDPQSGRVAAFAVADNYLLLSTREDLLAGALAMLAGGNAPSLASESWYRDAIAAAGSPGELRLVLAMDKIAATPYFRSYWIPRNISELGAYRAAISDFHREGSVDREERVLLPKLASAAPAQASPGTGAYPLAGQPPVPASAQRAAAELLRLVPADAGFYRVVAGPSAAECLSLVKASVLFPRIGPGPPSPMAPSVRLTGGVVGQASDLETRIDVAPPEFPQAGGGWEAFGKLIEGAGVQAALFVGSSDQDPRIGFVGNRLVVVLAASTPWKAADVRDALTAAIGQEVTTASLGAGWTSNGTQADGTFVLNGLLHAGFAVRGSDLFLANDAGTLASLLAATTASPGLPAPEPMIYAAGSHLTAERQNFTRLAAALDPSSPREGNPYQGARRQPPSFFSGNVGSLSGVLGGVVSEEMTIRQSGGDERQTVVYRWGR